MAVKKIAVVNVWVPVYSRQDDEVTNHPVECEVQFVAGSEITLVPRDGTTRPTHPYLCKFFAQDIRAILDEGGT